MPLPPAMPHAYDSRRTPWLTPGARVGPCEILSALGAGGMGEVYRARDTKLDREVAIKILPEVFVSDPDRVARFVQAKRKCWPR